MMPIKRSMTPEERKQFRREVYENYKKSFIALFHEQNYDEKYLNEFLMNSLRNYEEELKEDGLI